MVTSLVTRDGRIFFGWFVVAASLLVSFGVIGGQFSFGVFMKPMTEDFGWSRATLSLAFGTTFMLSGLLRPVAGYLADRYSPKWVALSGVAIMGIMLLVLTQVQNLTQLYIVFAVMALGITLGSGSALAKIVSAWFHRSRGVTLGLLTGGGSIGAVILVPAASSFIEVATWREGYLFLGMFLMVLVLPLGILFIRTKPQDMGLEPLRATQEQAAARRTDPAEMLRGRDATFQRGPADRTLLEVDLRVLRLRVLDELRECSLRIILPRLGIPSNGGSSLLQPHWHLGHHRHLAIRPSVRQVRTAQVPQRLIPPAGLRVLHRTAVHGDTAAEHPVAGIGSPAGRSNPGRASRGTRWWGSPRPTPRTGSAWAIWGPSTAPCSP